MINNNFDYEKIRHRNKIKQSLTEMQVKQAQLKYKKITPSWDKALVYIIRPAGLVVDRSKVKIECNTNYLGTLRQENFLYIILNPGQYNFVSSILSALQVRSVKLYCEAGRSYFLLQKVFKTRSRITGIKLKIISEKKGRKKLENCYLVESKVDGNKILAYDVSGNLSN